MRNGRLSLKEPENLRFAVVGECDGCGGCVQTSPAHFAFVPGRMRATVVRQPASVDEHQRCREAMRQCPLAAIGLESMYVTV